MKKLHPFILLLYLLPDATCLFGLYVSTTIVRAFHSTRNNIDVFRVYIYDEDFSRK